MNFHNYTKEEAIIELHPRENEFSLRTEDILDVIDKQGDEIALVMMSGVQYYTGQFFNIPLITSAAHKFFFIYLFILFINLFIYLFIYCAIYCEYLFMILFIYYLFYF